MPRRARPGRAPAHSPQRALLVGKVDESDTRARRRMSHHGARVLAVPRARVPLPKPCGSACRCERQNCRLNVGGENTATLADLLAIWSVCRLPRVRRARARLTLRLPDSASGRCGASQLRAWAPSGPGLRAASTGREVVVCTSRASMSVGCSRMLLPVCAVPTRQTKSRSICALLRRDQSD